jgi:signal transduction histidine kinase
LLSDGQPIFPGAAIVFCGIDRRQFGTPSLPPNVTGVLLKREFAPTLEVALRLHPDTERIVVVAGTSKFDSDLLAQAQEEFRPYENRLAFTYLTTLPLSETLARLSRLPRRTIVLFTTFFRDGAGEAFVAHEVVERVSSMASAPVYGFVDQFLGRGIVGGSLYSLALQGQEAARLALRIMAGTAPSELPLKAPASSTLMFDWRQLQRWGISESLLPANSEVRFRAPTVWDEYRSQIALIGIALVAQAVLIGVLLHENLRRRRAEASASKLQSDLAHMNRVATAGELTASIAHEIRQPLTAIAMNGAAGLKWLKQKTPDLEEVKRVLEGIVSATDRADAVLDNIRAMFRHEPTSRIRVDVADLVQQVLMLTMHQISLNKVTVKTDFVKKPSPHVLADPVQLQQVVLNLILNAVEAMSSPAVQVRELRLSTGIDPADHVLITIADTGPGIDPSVADKIFTPFFTTKSGGMGIGLSICKSIIAAHQGRLIVTPGNPSGTVFQISLPNVDARADERDRA